MTALTAALGVAPTAAHARCYEHSRVVGHQQCRRYGDGWSWAVPGLTATVGVSSHLIDYGALDFAGSVNSPVGSRDYVLRGAQVGHSSQLFASLDSDFTFAVSHEFYVGLSLQTGLGALRDGSTFGFGDVTVTPNALMYFLAAGHAGYALDLIPGALQLRGEALVGMRALAIVATGAPATPRHSGADGWSFGLIVEPRLALEGWITPWISAGGYVALDLITGAGMGESFGLYVRAHASGYDGAGRR